MNKTKIEWCDYTFNPLTGCLNNCYYCYAKRIAMRFYGHFKPTWHEERLKEPYKLKIPSKIFVCSMADLFGDWVPKEWIEKVIQVTKGNPQHIFQFLTKNPKRYLEFEFPNNCWLGATMDMHKEDELYYWKILQCEIEDLLKTGNYTFISFEPLLGSAEGLDLSKIDLVIVGAMTGPKAVKPKKEWIKSIKHHHIFYKTNIKKYL